MSGPDNRQTARRIAEHVTTCTSGERVCEVVVCDLSEGGCRVDGADLALKVGNRAEVRIHTFGVFSGTVAWVGKGSGGIEFDTTLHSAVVQFIANQVGARSGFDTKTRDRFGRVLPNPPKFAEFFAD